MAVGGEAATPRLACGRDAAGVWEDAETGSLDDHEQTCPYCQTVVADAAVLDAATVELAAEPIDPPATLVDRVMSVVRAELRRDYLPLPARHGPARIERGSAAAVLRHATDQMPGVRAHSCRITLPERPEGDEQTDQHPGTPAEQADQHPGTPAEQAAAVVRISVAMAFGADMPSTAARVQQLILAAADRLLGLPVDRVDVVVVDVFDPTQPAPGWERTAR